LVANQGEGSPDGAVFFFRAGAGVVKEGHGFLPRISRISRKGGGMEHRFYG
jgi:hypothetical protein